MMASMVSDDEPVQNLTLDEFLAAVPVTPSTASSVGPGTSENPKRGRNDSVLDDLQKEQEQERVEKAKDLGGVGSKRPTKRRRNDCIWDDLQEEQEQEVFNSIMNRLKAPMPTTAKRVLVSKAKQVKAALPIDYIGYLCVANCCSELHFRIL